MTKKATLLVAMSLLLPLLVACEEEPEPVLTGDLQVTYRIGSGTSTCDVVGIRTVRVYLDTTEGEPFMDENFPCDAENQVVTFEDLPVGTYQVRVEGLNDDLDVAYEGEASDPTEIEADQTNGPVDVILNQLRPSLEVIFDFEEAGGCNIAGVVEIVVRVYEDGLSLVHDETYDCVEQLNAEPLRIGNLSDSSAYDIRVRGTNDNGEYVQAFDDDALTVAPGAPTTVEAVMEVCPTLCSQP